MSEGSDFLIQRYEALRGNFTDYLFLKKISCILSEWQCGKWDVFVQDALVGPLLRLGRRQQCGHASVRPGFQPNGKTFSGSSSWGHLLLTIMEKWNHPSIPSWAHSVTDGTSHMAGNVSFDPSSKNRIELASWWWVPRAFWVPRRTSPAWYHEGVKWGETLTIASSTLCFWSPLSSPGLSHTPSPPLCQHCSLLIVLLFPLSFLSSSLL